MRFFQKGFNYNQDGPGNRLVYHLQGCNMRCRWCCNPESFELDGGKEITAEELINECERSKMMFFDSGGVTFTGGEATLCFDELKGILEELKKRKIHTAIETNGTNKRLPELFGLVDFLIMDFKHFDDEKHKEYTGVDMKIIKQNFEKICESSRQACIRIPLVKEFNFDADGFGNYFKKFNTENITFEVLSYHEYGVNKWKTEYKIHDGKVSRDEYINFCNKLREYNLNVTGG